MWRRRERKIGWRQETPDLIMRWAIVQPPEGGWGDGVLKQALSQKGTNNFNKARSENTLTKENQGCCVVPWVERTSVKKVREGEGFCVPRSTNRELARKEGSSS